MQTPIKIILVYLENLEAHRAEMSVILGEIESLPHAKKNATRRTVQNWQKIIRAKFGSSQQQTTDPRLHKAMLAMRGISVQSPKTKEK